MKSIRLITFDVMGTLIKPKNSIGTEYHIAARKQKSKSVTYSINSQTLDAKFPVVFKQMWSEFPNFGVNHGMSSAAWWRQVVRSTFLRALDLEPQDAMYGRADMWLDDVATSLFRRYAEPGAWKVDRENQLLLSSLKSSLKLGIISNFDERIHDILSGLRLTHFFVFVVASREVAVHKPDPMIFDIALHRSGVRDASQALHVGDNFQLDYLAARDAGWNSVWLNEGKEVPEGLPVESSHIIRSLSDLANIVQVRTKPTVQPNPLMNVK